ncbi:1897f41c-57b4-48c5-80d4-68c5ba380a6f [Sclerotinia trifoliorum]|uniref:1897f41c-57b4-48c5-80d4-68c5ba380a6f n=1 Tax=Sclerotinia trifoliorum TaxID=28548 RepID=A0A8H2W595_9HELO|nr:1897f41c-57b4-48c5-80d4-68c5ba380a6f [Sclerotinia trifoliorum]
MNFPTHQDIPWRLTATEKLYRIFTTKNRGLQDLPLKSKMSNTSAPNSTQHTSQDDTPKIPIKTSENLKVDQFKKPIGELIWENRILRTAIKELEIANTKAGAEKRLTKTRISIFEKLDASYFLHLTDAQTKLRKSWMAQGTEIIRSRLNFDASGADIHRDVYECSIKSWRDSYTRRDDIEIIISLLVMTHETAGMTAGMLSATTDKVTALESEITEHKKRLKVQKDVVASIQEREKVLSAEMKSRHEKELKGQKDVIAGLKEKERIFAAETKVKYEKMLEEQREIIANLEEKGKSISHANSKYEEKLKEQSSIIAKLEKEKIASATEMEEMLRELAVHSEISISILNRKREMMKPFESRSEHVIVTGNIAAHGGTCLADVFRVKSNADVDDSRWFKERYGVSVDIVERHAGSAAFAKLVNMRYDMCNCGPGQRKLFLEFEKGFQDLLIGDLERDTKITTEAIDCFLLKNQKAKETFQKLCGIWDTATATQRKRFQESRDPIKRSFFGGSVKSNTSHRSGETWRRSKLDNIEEYGKDILSSAKYAMPWGKPRAKWQDPRYGNFYRNQSYEALPPGV